MSKSRKILHKLLFGDYFSCKLHDLCISLQMLNTIFILLHCKYNETVHVRKCYSYCDSSESFDLSRLISKWWITTLTLSTPLDWGLTAVINNSCCNGSWQKWFISQHSCSYCFKWICEGVYFYPQHHPVAKRALRPLSLFLCTNLLGWDWLPQIEADERKNCPWSKCFSVSL